MLSCVRGLRSLLSLLAALLLAASLCGCATEGGPRRTARGAIKGFADGLAQLDPELLKKLRSMYLSDTGLNEAARELTAALVAGAGEGLQRAQIDKLARQTVIATMGALREEGVGTLQDLAKALPKLEDAAQQAVTRLIMTTGSALRASATQDLSVATRLLVHATVEELLRTIAPFLQSLAAETRRYASESLAPSAGLVAHAMAREAMLGAQEGLTQATQGKEVPLRAVMREIGAGLAEGMKEGMTDNGSLRAMLISGLVLLSTLLVAVVVGAYILWRRYRRTTASLIMFAKRINESQKTNEEYSRSLREAIYKAHAENKQDTWLRDFLLRRGL